MSRSEFVSVFVCVLVCLVRSPASMCIDNEAKRMNLHKPVGLYPCHNQVSVFVCVCVCVCVFIYVFMCVPLNVSIAFHFSSFILVL